ncbi:MAG: hypothetical protein AMJ43_03815 [Coxiella sp. DG_40]|nr:MAG: hypothetical protein AMJ43_03815 [Coxiella sp. DG_40]
MKSENEKPNISQQALVPKLLPILNQIGPQPGEYTGISISFPEYCFSFVTLYLYFNKVGKKEVFFKTLEYIADIPIELNSIKLNESIRLFLTKFINWILLLKHKSKFDFFRVDLNINKFIAGRDYKFAFEYGIAFNFSLEELNRTLSLIIKEDKMVLLASEGHSLGLYCRNRTYYLYDPNNPSGEREYRSLDEVAKNIKNISSNDNSLFILVFDLNTAKKEEYPCPVELITEFLSQRKVNVHSGYFTDLLYIASCFGWSEIVEELSRQKMISDERCDDCYPLTSAVYYGNQNVVELLLNCPEIDVNYLDSSDYTPLHVAVLNKNIEMVLLLYSHKANFNMPNNQGETASDCLREFARKGDHFIDLLIANIVNNAIVDEELGFFLLELQQLMLESQQEAMKRFEEQIKQGRADLEYLTKESEPIKKQKLEHVEASVEQVIEHQFNIF